MNAGTIDTSPPFRTAGANSGDFRSSRETGVRVTATFG